MGSEQIFNSILTCIAVLLLGVVGVWGDECAGPQDCSGSMEGKFCCYERGQCCGREEYLESEKSCDTNINCPTDADYYYCCVSTKTCCSYETYQEETDAQLNHMIAAFTCASFFLIMGVCLCFACWKLFNRPSARSSVSAVAAVSLTDNLPGDACTGHRCDNPCSSQLRCGINVVNLRTLDGSISQFQETTLHGGLRCFMEVPRYDAPGATVETAAGAVGQPGQEPTGEVLEAEGSSGHPRDTPCASPELPQYSPPPVYKEENLGAPNTPLGSRARRRASRAQPLRNIWERARRLLRGIAPSSSSYSLPSIE